MAGKRHDDGRVCLCDRPDGTCAGLAVRRLSRDRVRDLAEEIWTASPGYLTPVRDLPDPRSSRAGASAETAYRRRREQERATWRPGWAWRAWAVAGAALAAGLLIGATVGARVAALGQLPGIVRSGPATPPGELEQATGRLLEVLRPAA